MSGHDSPRARAVRHELNGFCTLHGLLGGPIISALPDAICPKVQRQTSWRPPRARRTSWSGTNPLDRLRRLRYTFAPTPLHLRARSVDVVIPAREHHLPKGLELRRRHLAVRRDETHRPAVRPLRRHGGGRSCSAICTRTGARLWRERQPQALRRVCPALRAARSLVFLPMHPPYLPRP